MYSDWELWRSLSHSQTSRTALCPKHTPLYTTVLFLFSSYVQSLFTTCRWWSLWLGTRKFHFVVVAPRWPVSRSHLPPALFFKWVRERSKNTSLSVLAEPESASAVSHSVSAVSVETRGRHRVESECRSNCCPDRSKQTWLQWKLGLYKTYKLKHPLFSTI
jgi:hypothetical protein